MTELRFPSPADVQSIVDPDNDPILRNLRITQGYHDLSAEMLRLTGRNDINWCTLGCWASKTAGKFIRSEEVPREFRRLLTSKGPFEEIEAETKGLGLVNVAAGIIDDVSTYITAGNRVVFEELAGVFSSFLTELGDDEHRDQKKLDAFTARLEPGPPEPDDATIEASGKIVTKRRGGQDLMRKMVESLYSAKFETDPKRRAELLLLSNGCGGLHEQTRLQTYIAGSLNAPIADTVLRHAHDHVDRHIHESKKSTLHTFLERILPSIGKTVEKAWQDFSTIAFMTLQLPDGAMHLARLMPADPGGPLIPPVLQRIEHPELRNMLGVCAVGRFSTRRITRDGDRSVSVTGEWAFWTTRRRWVRHGCLNRPSFGLICGRYPCHQAA